MLSESELTEKSFMVPVDKSITAFRKHLLSHPRTILSAKYGDGKSYFLQEMAEDEKMQEKFVFLTLYPVSYQVVSNEDIFDLIKYDLIAQLYAKGFLDDIEGLSDSILLYWFLITHQKDLIQFFATVASKIGYLPEKLVKLLEPTSQLITKWKEFKKTHEGGYPDVEKLSEKIEKHYLYEADLVTSFIREAIEKYKKVYPDKRVVLVIEDMDRLDPAHLFRILNVLSAHVDYAYRYGVSPDKETVEGNKFGVDNVLLVMDYYNTQAIYHHFYGEKANFEGYINKFISHGLFEYSLAQERFKYFTEYLFKEVHIKETLLREIIPESFYEGKTIREVRSAMRNTREQLFDVPTYNDVNGTRELHIGMLQLLVVMRRLGKTDDEIENHLNALIINHPIDMMYYLGGYWLTYTGRMPMETVHVKYPSRKGHSLFVEIHDVNNDGLAMLQREEDMFTEVHTPDDMKDFARYLLVSVAQEEVEKNR